MKLLVQGPSGIRASVTLGVANALQELKTPPTSYFIKKALDLKGGSQKPGHQAAGQLSLKHVLEIATVTARPIPLTSILFRF